MTNVGLGHARGPQRSACSAVPLNSFSRFSHTWHIGNTDPDLASCGLEPKVEFLLVGFCMSSRWSRLGTKKQFGATWTTFKESSPSAPDSIWIRTPFVQYRHGAEQKSTRHFFDSSKRTARRHMVLCTHRFNDRVPCNHRSSATPVARLFKSHS